MSGTHMWMDASEIGTTMYTAEDAAHHYGPDAVGPLVLALAGNHGTTALVNGTAEELIQLAQDILRVCYRPT